MTTNLQPRGLEVKQAWFVPVLGGSPFCENRRIRSKEQNLLELTQIFRIFFHFREPDWVSVFLIHKFIRFS
jgi:hypothetical protein